MPRYFVHRYDVVRVKVAVEADDHKAAMLAADDYLARNHPISNRYHGGAGEDEALAENIGLPTWLEHEEAGQAVTGYLIDEFDDAERRRSIAYDQRMNPQHDALISQSDFPHAAWRAEIATNQTFDGYTEWVSMKRDQGLDKSVGS
ncbi:hypothetical protein [Tardiphaga sp.]|uniref:hypothetical protein n=1 Tax=Tardiphaga sp. TaxID=1926292 RepID=UPI00352BCDE3